jgi:uncharacterized membrane protein
MTSTTEIAPSITHRQASWRNLALVYVVGVVLLGIQSVAYHHYTHENKLASDLPFYVVSGLIGVLIAAIALVRVNRSSKAMTTPRIGIVLGALAVVLFPVGYYTPITFVWGATAFLLSHDAVPGRAATAARALGIVAMLCQVALVIARICGVTFQIGG